MTSVQSGVGELDPMQQIEKDVDSAYLGYHEETNGGPEEPMAYVDSEDRDPPRWRGPTIN